jgi:hypothetical protein
MKCHLNWSACADWYDARARLKGFGATLYGNFADVTRGVQATIVDLRARGFSVSPEPNYLGQRGVTLLRLS